MVNKKKKMAISGILLFSLLSIIPLSYFTFNRSNRTPEKNNDQQSSQLAHIEPVGINQSSESPNLFQSSKSQPSTASNAEDLTSDSKAKFGFKSNVVATSANIPALKKAARVAMDHKAYDKARKSLEKAFASTADPDEQMEIGQQLYESLIRTHAYTEALELGRTLLSLNPTPGERLTLTQQMAALLHRMKKSDAAEKFLREAIEAEQNPSNREQLQAQLRGMWRYTEGRTAQVVSDLTAQLDQNPEDEEALQELGEIHLKSRRDYKAALPVYEQLAALNPKDQKVQSTLLRLYRETDNFDGLRRAYENRLSQSGGDDPTLRFQIARTELQAGRGDSAVEYAEQHLSGNNATPFELQMLSTIYDKAGRKDEAMVTLDTAIASESNWQQRVSMQFQKAGMLIWHKQYTEAERLLRSIIKAAGDDRQTNSHAKSEIVRIYEIQGKLSELNF